MMINFPLFGVLWKLERFQLNEEFYLRLIAVCLCMLLFSHRFWQPSFCKFIPIIWYLTLLYCLPFFFCYLTLSSHGSTLWLMNCVSAIFFLLLVINAWDALVLLCLGIGLGVLCFFCNSSLSAVYMPGEITLFSLFVTFSAAIIIGGLFAQDRERMYAGRLSAMQLLAGSLAHDLRTPLASIHLQAELQEIIVEKLNNNELQDDLKRSLQKINRGIEMSNQLITMQLNNIKQEKFDTYNFSIFSIQQLIEKALESYPFKEQEKQIINSSFTDDFLIWIEEIGFKNLLWNLLKNSLDCIELTGKGMISIWLDAPNAGDDFNYLHVLDTAKGIYPKHAEKIFDPFYSDKKGGTGVGLAYCKLLMQTAGGDVYCQGKLNQYIQFTLKFPKVD